ncbi:MAG: alpha/beta fold hydrolase [Vulcanimicrobiota bacterium]
MTLLGQGLRLVSRIAPARGGKIAWTLFCTPYPLAQATSEQQRVLDQARRHQLAFGERLLDVYRWPNQGPRVLLMHGWGGKACSFARMAEVLHGAGLEVIAFDGPGHQKPFSRTNLLECSSALRKLARELGPIHTLVGHSFGALTSAHAAGCLDELQGLVMIGGPQRLDWVLGDAQAKLDAPQPSMDFIYRRIEKLSGRPVVEHTTADYLQAARVRTLIVHDTQDKEVPFAPAEQQAQALGADFLATSGWGHRRILNAPEVAHRIATFVRA